MSLIVGEFYVGQGLGNQLYTYASIRGLAESLGFDFAFCGKELFKGADIFDLDFGVQNFDYPNQKRFERRRVDKVCGHDFGVGDAGLFKIRVPTKVEGLLASPLYWRGGGDYLRKALKVRWIEPRHPATKAGCVVHIRGGDFLASNSRLSRQYYSDALACLGVSLEDVVVLTDDVRHAIRILGPRAPVFENNRSPTHPMTAEHHIGGSFVDDFWVLLTANAIVLSNSSFAFWGAVLNPSRPRVVAPKFWAAHECDRCHWSPGDLYCPEFQYV